MSFGTRELLSAEARYMEKKEKEAWESEQTQSTVVWMAEAKR